MGGWEGGGGGGNWSFDTKAAPPPFLLDLAWY